MAESCPGSGRKGEFHIRAAVLNRFVIACILYLTDTAIQAQPQELIQEID